MQKQAIRASVYRQAALARLAEAEYLKKAHPAGAIYLGGYVIECMLKWAICKRNGIIYLDDLPDQKLADRLTSARGHDLDFLLDISGLRPRIEADDELYKSFQTIIQEQNLHPTRFDMELTMAETVHIHMTAPEFSGKTDTERDLMIWPALEKKLPRRIMLNISVCVLLAPDEEKEAEIMAVA